MNATLLILAAGMGSRFGGLKQLEPVGPSGETLLDYSIYDALRAGFARVVFVIRRDFAEEFREKVGRSYEAHIEVSYVFQELDNLPAGFIVPTGRSKPWGTGHAIWCAREEIAGPFAAINADDFYGAEAFRLLGDFFRANSGSTRFAMVGYRLDRTLSEHGGVSRGVCVADARGDLLSVKEHTKLERTDEGIRCDGILFDGSEIVSMNFWGFQPTVFSLLTSGLEDFLRAHGQEEKSEFYIPFAVGDMMAKKAAQVSVLTTDGDWFGVTYREDKETVIQSIAWLVKKGVYPPSLWKNLEALA